MSVRFAPAAVWDLEEIGDYIGADNPQAARQLVADLRKRCAQLAHAPRSGVRRPEFGIADLYSVSFRRYVLFYTLSGDDVRIERVLHGARDIETTLSGGF